MCTGILVIWQFLWNLYQAEYYNIYSLIVVACEPLFLLKIIDLYSTFLAIIGKQV